MAAMVVCGGGTCGLIAAMLLAQDGHEVTVLERDAMEPPPPSEAWDAWERRGVNQFRLAHFLLSRWHHEMRRELPDLVEALSAAGAYEFNFFGPFREVVPEPERFDVLTARRPVLEAAVAAVASNTPGITIRRGVAIAGVEVGTPAVPGVPHVTGVRTDTGEVVKGDLVVAATGRRSPLARWLAGVGARPAIEEEEDSGFVYFGRYVRSRDGSQLVDAPGMRDFGSISLLALPADDGTAGLGLIATPGDAPLRRLKDEATWERVLRRLPGGERLLESDPIGPLVVMGAIEDRYRRFVVDGVPVATGVVPVADSWAATNPTLGRGISLGTMHAVLLRNVVRDHLDDPHALVMAFDEATERDLTPWYRATVWHDRHRIGDIAAEAQGVAPPTDERWASFVRLSRAVGTDLDLSVRWATYAGFLGESVDSLLDDVDLMAKVPADLGDQPHGGPTRQELLDLVG